LDDTRLWINSLSRGGFHNKREEEEIEEEINVDNTLIPFAML